MIHQGYRDCTGKLKTVFANLVPMRRKYRNSPRKKPSALGSKFAASRVYRRPVRTQDKDGWDWGTMGAS